MCHQMKGQEQLRRSAVAKASAEAVWRILADSTVLPRWAPAVDRVDRCDEAGESVGSVRRCSVQLGGRTGTMVERCVALDPGRSIAYVVDDDTFGMSRMFADYGFRVTVEPLGPHDARVTIATYYTPRNLLYAALNAMMLRRQFRGVVDQLIAGLAELAEGTDATYGTRRTNRR